MCETNGRMKGNRENDFKKDKMHLNENLNEKKMEENMKKWDVINRKRKKKN